MICCKFARVAFNVLAGHCANLLQSCIRLQICTSVRAPLMSNALRRRDSLAHVLRWDHLGKFSVTELVVALGDLAEDVGEAVKVLLGDQVANADKKKNMLNWMKFILPLWNEIIKSNYVVGLWCHAVIIIIYLLANPCICHITIYFSNVTLF